MAKTEDQEKKKIVLVGTYRGDQLTKYDDGPVPTALPRGRAFLRFFPPLPFLVFLPFCLCSPPRNLAFRFDSLEGYFFSLHTGR